MSAEGVSKLAAVAGSAILSSALTYLYMKNENDKLKKTSGM
jgi:hypothetical protein